MKKRMKRHAVTQPLGTSYRFIPLTRGQNSIVDAEDFEWLNKWNWYAFWSTKTKSFYAERKPTGKLIRMHREILKCGILELVDHKNHDTLDNRKENLRKATHSQNSCNRRSNILKGVSWHKKAAKWRCYIKINGKQIHLGLFTDKPEASKTYNEAACQYFGEFAHYNPEPG